MTRRKENTARKKKGATRNRRSSAHPISVPAILDATSAGELQAKFRALAREEAQAQGPWLYAQGSYGKPERSYIVAAERWNGVRPEGRVIRKSFQVCAKEECGYWHLVGGATTGIRPDFKALATEAGSKFRVPEGATPFECWMHQLFHYLRSEGDPHLRGGADDTGGIIERATEASADFCAWMKVQAHVSPSAVQRLSSSSTKPEERPARSVRGEGLMFAKSPDGGTVAKKCDDMRSRVLATYDQIHPELETLRTMVMGSTTRIGPKKLRKMCSKSPLADMADDTDWKEWIANFSSPNRGTAKGAALVFLEKKTGLSRKTLKGYLSRARRAQK